VTTAAIRIWARPDDARATALAKALKAAAGLLGLPKGELIVLRAGPLPSDVPCAAAWFEDGPDPVVPEGLTLLPVLRENLERFTARAPPVLHPINGQADDGSPTSLQEMVQVLLQAVGLVRRLRRAFVSHARRESSGVARQLAGELVSRGYEVFLDTWSVDKAAPFQPTLWDRMAGSDLVVFCDTVNALDSHWVRQELHRARQWDLTVLHLIWPDGRPADEVLEKPRDPELALSQALYLERGNFLARHWPGTAPARLRQHTLRGVVDTVEQLRVQAFAVRQARLREALLRRLRLAGIAHRVEPAGGVELPEHRVLPVVGHPTARDFWQAGQDHPGGRELLLLHDARGADGTRRRVLDHLADHLPVGLVERSRVQALVPGAKAAMKSVFLSASVPDPKRHPRYHRTGDVVAIRAAVEALAAVVIEGGGTLVFGGHPAISPFVRDATGSSERVRIYQSRFFWDLIPEASRGFPDLVWTEAVGDDRPASLEKMRREMIGSEDFDAAVFIGGMEGVEAELAIWREQWPERPAWPVGSTGGAARLVLGAGELGLSPELAERLTRDRAYEQLFEELLGG